MRQSCDLSRVINHSLSSGSGLTVHSVHIVPDTREVCVHCMQGIFTVFVGILPRTNPLHDWLRSIKGGQFRLVNFASHFIRVQIFQIDFPLILYL